MEIGRKIYYDILTGEVLVDTGERKGSVIKTTLEDDVSTFKALSERNVESFDFLELEYGEYGPDFMECVGYRVNVENKSLEFSYPEDGVEEPSYQEPLSERVAKLEMYLDEHEAALIEITEMIIGGDE